MRPTLSLLGVLAIGLTMTGGTPCQAATISETRIETQSLVVLENEFIRMTVDMLHGGKVTSFTYKPLEREWLSSGQALFADHVWQQTWPGELFDVKYDYAITERGPKRVSVKVWRTLQRKGKVSIVGVKVERVLTLEDGMPFVTADITLSNPTERVKTVGYWSQHIFRLGGLNNNFNIRPSTTGLAVGTADVRDEGRKKKRVGAEWVKAPVAGWTATVNPTTREAVVCLMDYNDLRWLYNCIGNYTTEWYYDLLRMAPGSRWQTRILLVPRHGYQGVSFASQEVIADVRLMHSAKGFRPVYTVGCSRTRLDNVQLTTTLLSADRKRTLGSETVNLGAVDVLPRELVSSLSVPAKGEPFIVTVRISGKGFTRDFEKPFGDYNRSDRLVAGVFDTGYAIKPPPKQKTLDRPANLQKLPHEGMAVFEARGQFYSAWRLKDALKGLGTHSLKPGHFSSNVYGEQLDYFPAGYQEIMGLDVVVLNNVPAGALSPNDQALLVDYVRHGGGLLVLGGWYAFGGGGYADSAIAEALPVASGKPFDITRYKQGLPIQPGAGDLFSDAFRAEKPVVLWLQQVPRVKNQAEVTMKAGEKPFVVQWRFGKGRVACVLGTPMGISPANGKPFFQCDQWPAILGDLLGWLKDADRNSP